VIIEHNATQQEMHELFGESLAGALRDAADLIESKEKDGWQVGKVGVTGDDFNRVEVVFLRRLQV
jgi:hypothetical protein